MGTKTTTTPQTAPQTPDAAASAVDENAGVGGSYVIENGQRRLVERTQPADQLSATNEGN